MKSRLVAIAIASSLALVACGGSPELDVLSGEELDVATARSSIASYVSDRNHELDDDFQESISYQELVDGVDRLIEIYRAKPDAVYDGKTMRQVLQDAASDLDQDEPDLAAKIDRAID